MYNICFYLSIFFIYSIVGWVVDCISCSIRFKRIVLNRGLLLGPYCPAYGIGAIYIYVFLSKYYYNPVFLFVMSVIGTSVIEYIASYLMEKIFKARWWDYSERKFNLNGRICLFNCIGFGLLGILFVYILNPLFLSFYSKIPITIVIVLNVILSILFIVDCIVSIGIIIMLKTNLQNIRKDSTDDIDLEVKKILSSYYYYLRKIFKSYPKVKFNLSRGESIINSINKTIDNFDSYGKERKKKIREIRKELKNKIREDKNKW